MDLMYGELSAHGMMINGDTPTVRSKLVYHINVALTELYTRFPLLLKDVNVEQYSQITQYHLNSEYAVTNTTSVEPIKYIIDSTEYPFTDDVIRIEQAYNEEGEEITLNDPCACVSIFTPSMDVIEIPNPVETNVVSIIYRAKHPMVEAGTVDLLLPTQFKPALLAYIAHRVYSGGTAQEHTIMANQMLQKYELFCSQQREYGMTNQDENMYNVRLANGGWV